MNEPCPPSDDLSLPDSPAWFAHRVDGARRFGVVVPDGPHFVDAEPDWDVAPRDPSPELTGLSAVGSGLGTATGLRALAATGTPLDPASIHWDVPIARPGKILCFGKNFAAHAAEFGAEVPEEPLFFTKLPDTLQAHAAPIVLPWWVETRIDHEIELAVILGFADPEGRGRKYVEPAEAMELVAGYTVLNDVTARRMQGDDRGAQKPWLRCKSFDTFCPIGPWVVPADALDPHDLAIELWVNDELRQASHTSKMVVDVPTAIAWLSKHTTLRPGDLIAMGTPEGVGPLRDGDVCTGRIERIGVLRNPVRREAAPPSRG